MRKSWRLAQAQLGGDRHMARQSKLVSTCFLIEPPSSSWGPHPPHHLHLIQMSPKDQISLMYLWRLRVQYVKIPRENLNTNDKSSFSPFYRSSITYKLIHISFPTRLNYWWKVSFKGLHAYCIVAFLIAVV